MVRKVWFHLTVIKLTFHWDTIITTWSVLELGKTKEHIYLNIGLSKNDDSSDVNWTSTVGNKKQFKHKLSYVLLSCSAMKNNVWSIIQYLMLLAFRDQNSIPTLMSHLVEMSQNSISTLISLLVEITVKYSFSCILCFHYKTTSIIISNILLLK